MPSRDKLHKITKNTRPYYYQDKNKNIWLTIYEKSHLYLKFEKEGSQIIPKLISDDRILIDFTDYKSRCCSFSLGSIPMGYNYKKHKIFLIKPGTAMMDYGIRRGKRPDYFYPFDLLHELGHSRLHSNRKSPDKIKEIGIKVEFEIEAWIYALENINKYKSLLPYNKKDLYSHIKNQVFSYIKSYIRNKVER